MNSRSLCLDKGLLWCRPVPNGGSDFLTLHAPPSPFIVFHVHPFGLEPRHFGREARNRFDARDGRCIAVFDRAACRLRPGRTWPSDEWHAFVSDVLDRCGKSVAE